jgi:hypothetical protein
MLRNSLPIASRQISILILVSIAPFGSAAAQMSSPPFLQSVARISLIARLPSSVRLSQNLIRVSADVSGDACGEVTVPVDVRWNVEPWVQEVQLVGSFLDSAPALSDGRGHVLPAARLELLLEDSTWTPLPQSNARARSSGFPLATIAIVRSGRQSGQEIPLHFRICRADGDFTPGTYSGEIQLRSNLR